MAAPNYYKCEIIWNCINRGWTETYYLYAEAAGFTPPAQGNPNNAENFTAINSFFKEKIVTPRALLSGKECVVVATRISGVKGQLGLTPNDGAFLDYKTMPKSNQSETSDNPPSTLVTTIYDAFTKYKHQIHIRGIWDSIDVTGGVLDLPQNFLTVFQSYAAAVTKPGWGWISRRGPQTAGVTGYTVVVPSGAVRFDFDAPIFDLLDVGKHKTISISGLNFGQSALNGAHTVLVKTTTSAQTVTKIAVDPFVEEGKVRYNPALFVQNALADPTKIGSRDTGGSIFLGRGRARKKVQY
jgi:hypothetical protein